MNEEITAKLLKNNDEKFDRILSILDNVISGLNQLDGRLTNVEKNKAETNPLWQVIRDEQLTILKTLQEQATRFDRVEERLSQFEVKISQLTEQMSQFEERLLQMEERMQQRDIRIDDSLRRVRDKLDILNQAWLEVQADYRYLDRRVTQLEPHN